MNPTMPNFGDRVRIAETDQTREYGYAGLEGEVFGESIPSSSGVGPVIGDRGDDRALCVHFTEHGQMVWFAPHLVELLDHQEGLALSLDGGPTFRRQADGSWKEVGGPTEAGRILNPGGGVPKRVPDGFSRVLKWLRSGGRRSG